MIVPGVRWGARRSEGRMVDVGKIGNGLKEGGL